MSILRPLLLAIPLLLWAETAWAQFDPPSGGSTSSFGFDGGPIQSSGVTTSFVDAGIVTGGAGSQLGGMSFNAFVQMKGSTSTGLELTNNAPVLFTAGTSLTGNASTGNWTIAGGSLVANARNIATAQSTDGGTSFAYIEYTRGVMSSGTKTVVFKNAFASEPACFCSDGTALNACDVPISTISTTQAVVNGTTSDQFALLCIGPR